MTMRLFVDDLRPCPEEWLLARNYWQAIELLEKHWDELEVVSLDHDIASFREGKEYTGSHLADWIENKARDKAIRFQVLLHSSNPVGSEYMFRVLSSLTTAYRINSRELYKKQK